ncbi:MAG TPA: phosphonopyruvate decarboxylase [Gammaproteobacteria bacterium]|jgi:phosphonopyruvate decarboxylase
MLEAGAFIDAARAAGFSHYAGVPCSYLTPFINYVINDDGLTYVSAVNEGDAVAIAAGVAIGGGAGVAMMQNSGLGNAVSPLTSLAWVFRIPLLLITTQRGAPGIPDEPQHELMGRITEAMLDVMQVPHAAFPASEAEIGPALQQAGAWLWREQRPYALVMQKGAVAPCPLGRDSVPVRGGRPAAVHEFRTGSGRPGTRGEALRRAVELSAPESTVIIATTGYTGRELYAIADRPNHLYMVGSMGCAPSLALGLSLARPDLRVIVVDGDGAALMRMGNMATLGTYGKANLIHLLLDNGAHESTGGQATVSANVDFARVAAACGYGRACSGDDPGLIDALLEPEPGTQGARFGHLKIRPGVMDDLPRPEVKPPDVVRRLMRHIGAEFRLEQP